MKSKARKLKCAECGKWFKAVREHAKFHTTSCRLKHWAKCHPRMAIAVPVEMNYDH